MWFTPNFKNGDHQQKKAPNKGTRFLLNGKSISISQNEEFVEKYDFTGPKNGLISNQCLKKKMKKTVSTSIKQDFFKYWLPSNCIKSLKKCINERISFQLNRKCVATGRNKGFV